MSESGNKTQDVIDAYVDGVMTERERIINLLLNENQCPENDCNEVQCLLTRLVISLIKQKNVVELIKGEK
jgi:hypothetical protein